MVDNSATRSTIMKIEHTQHDTYLGRLSKFQVSTTTLSKHALHYKSYENTVGIGEIVHTKQH